MTPSPPIEPANAEAARSLFQALRDLVRGGNAAVDTDRLDARDPALIARLLPFARASNRRYLRLRAEGFDSLPRGPVLYVGNHNGGIAGPDLCCTLGTLWDALGPENPLYLFSAPVPDPAPRAAADRGAARRRSRGDPRAGAGRHAERHERSGAPREGALVSAGDAGIATGTFALPDGGQIAYQTSGPTTGAPPVLLIRPLGGSMALWGPFRAALAATHRIIAFDHRGSGRSSAAPLVTTTATLARDGLHLLDHLGVDSARVFGISLGGMVATWVALIAPSRVTRLCLAATPARGIALSRAGLGRGLSLAACLARPIHEMEACMVHRILSRRFRDEHGAEVREIDRRASEAPTSRAGLVQLALAGGLHDARRRLGRITAPTLVLAGDHDALLGTEAPRALAAAIPGAMFEIIENSGHDLSLEQPVVTAARVASFFDR
jgi:3-oxoadipate enol-lactonase